MKHPILILIVLLMLAACTPESAEEPVATAVPPTPTVAQAVELPTAVPTSPPTAEPALPEATEQPLAELPPTELPPTAVPETETLEIVYGRNQEGAFFHGNPDAPVTLIDFSDFL